MLEGLIRGGGHERPCRVSAIKVTNPTAPAHPAYANFEIVDSDNFPDSEDYELILPGQQPILLAKRCGEYVSRFG